MAGWNFAELWEAIADKFPDAQAQVQGEKRFTWREFDSRSDALAHHLIEGCAVHQDKVALYLYNCPEYMEGCYAAFKAGMVPVNTNYRYLDDELVYLWDNADAVAVVFHGTFTERVATVRPQLPKVRQWIWVDDGTDARPDWADDYAEVVATSPGRAIPPWGRSGDDVVMIYTGGTTGMPKGVMWRQDDLIGVTCATGNALLAADLADQVMLVAAADGQKEALELIKTGEYAATGLNNPALVAATAVDIAKQAIDGTLGDIGRVTYTEPAVITQENVDEFYNPDAVF